MEINESYRYIGVLASFAAWLPISIILFRWPTDKTKSISKHVASFRTTWLIFAPIETIALGFFYLFMINWFIPALNLPLAYTVLVTISLLLELISSWVPDTKGLSHTVHHHTAYAAVLLLPLLNGLILVSSTAPMIVKVVAGICLATTLGIITIYLTSKTARQRHLIYQTVYFACFHIPILVAIFTVK